MTAEGTPYDFRKIRLFVESGLAEGGEVALERDQAHYLGQVMRAKPGDRILLFNGRDGEWVAAIEAIERKSAKLAVEAQSRAQAADPDVEICFAPVKRVAIDYFVQKATELGASAIRPVFTRFTVINRVNLDRMRANAIEAAEQSGRLTLPILHDPVKLPDLIAGWDGDRKLLFCDEAERTCPIAEALQAEGAGPWGLLIGPEGGFHEDERALILRQPSACPVSLGSRILRADTAGLAALAVWQALLGDWRRP